MTNQQYKALVNKLGLSHDQIAKGLGLNIKSYMSMLQPSRQTPKWAVSFIMAYEAIKNDSST